MAFRSGRGLRFVAMAARGEGPYSRTSAGSNIAAMRPRNAKATNSSTRLRPARLTLVPPSVGWRTSLRALRQFRAPLLWHKAPVLYYTHNPRHVPKVPCRTPGLSPPNPCVEGGQHRRRGDGRSCPLPHFHTGPHRLDSSGWPVIPCFQSTGWARCMGQPEVKRTTP